MYTHVDAVYKRSAAKKAAKQVLLFIAHRTTREGFARLYHNDIAKNANVDRRTVTRAIGKLSSMGEIEIVERGHGRSNKTTYRFLLGIGDMVSPISELKEDTVPPFDGKKPIKQDMVSKKQDILNELESIKEKDINLLETPEPKESDPVVELGNEFSARTGIFPNHHSWNDSWEPVLQYMLNEAGSLEAAIGVLDAAIQKQRDARTKDGRPYTLSSPRSIQSFARQALTETNDMDDGPEQWELLCSTVRTWGSARAKDHLPAPTFTAFKAYAYAWSSMNRQQLDSQIRQPFLEKLREVRQHAAAIH